MNKTIAGYLFSSVIMLAASAPLHVAHAQAGGASEEEEILADPGPAYGYGYGQGPGGGYGPGIGGAPAAGSCPCMGGMGGPGAGGMMGPGMMGGYGGYGMGQGMMGGHGMGGMMGYSAGGGYGQGYGYGRGMMALGPIGALNLSAEQRTKIGQIEDNARKKNLDAISKIREERLNLNNLYLSETPDANKVSSAYDRLSKLRKQILMNNLTARNEIQSVLTKDQRNQLQQWRQGRVGGPGLGGWGTGYGAQPPQQQQ